MENQTETVERKRHIAKATTWRIVASLTTAVIALIFGLPPSAVGAVVIVDMIIKFVMYYVHERVWYKHIRYGIKK